MRGRFSRALSKWDRAKAWPERGNPSRPDAAPAAVVCTHRPGGPWVTVRVHYGTLPSMAGRGWSEGAKAPGIMAKASPRPGRTVPGSKKSPRRSAGRRCRVLCLPAIRGTGRGVLHCAFRRSASPHKRGGKLKDQLAWARENAGAWLSEIVNQSSEAHWRATLTAVIGGLRPGDPVRGIGCGSRERRCLPGLRFRADDESLRGNNAPDNNHRRLRVPANAWTTVEGTVALRPGNAISPAVSAPPRFQRAAARGTAAAPAFRRAFPSVRRPQSPARR